MPTPEPAQVSVLFFTNLFPTPVDRTRGIFHLQLVRELAAICDITVVCPLPWFPHWPFLRRFERWYAFAETPVVYEVDGITVHSPKYLMVPRISGALHGIFVYLGSLFTINRLHKLKQFDVINGLWLYPDAVAANWIAKRLGIPMVPAALGCDVNRMLNETDKRKRILHMLSGAHKIIAVADGLRERMVQAGIPAERISIVPNGVNSDLFYNRSKANDRACLDLPQDRKVIVFVGRLAEEKGLSTLVSAAGLIKTRRKDFLFCIVGAGPLLEELREQAATLGVADFIKFAGHQEHESIAIWLGACDVFCLPSLREGCPNVVVEALSSGRPVVASRVGGIPSMLRRDTGILVEPQNPQDLADALVCALDQAWDPVNVANSVRGNTWRAVAEKYLSIYRDAISVGRNHTPAISATNFKN